MLIKIAHGISLTLTNLCAVIGKPSTGLIDQLQLHTQIDELAVLGNAIVKEDLEVSLLKWRSYLILHHLNLGLITNDGVLILDWGGLADIKTYRSVILQGITTSGSLRITKHDTNLHTQLVNEDHHAVSLLNGTSELTQSLGHQTSLQTHVVVAHIALDLSLRN